MTRKKQISSYREILSNLCRYSTLKQVEPHSLLLKYELLIEISLQRVEYVKARGCKGSLHMERPDNHYLSRVISVSTNISIELVACLGIMCENDFLSRRTSSPKPITPFK